jgi:hypothetical protein
MKHAHLPPTVALLTSIDTHLREAMDYLQLMVKRFGFEGEVSYQEYGRLCDLSAKSAYKILTEGRLLISASITVQCEHFFSLLRHAMVNYSNARAPDIVDGHQRATSWDRASKIAYEELPKILEQIETAARQMIAVLPPDVPRSEAPMARNATKKDEPIPKYQVALSFAGEQREYVETVARALQARRIAVFYDGFEVVTLWGKDGAEFFHQLFAADAAYVVMFISKDYVAKKWTRHERRSALRRAIAEEGEYVLPVRFDDSIVPGLPNTIQYLKAEDHTPAALAALISEKIGISPLTAKASDLPPRQVSSLAGEVTFDYSAFNGRFIIGSGVRQFETVWSKSSDNSIYLYNDPLSINGIAVARGATRLADVVDASIYDFTSRARCPRLGEVAVLRNVHGFYAAIHILTITDDTRGADRDEVRIRFAIHPDGASSFSAYINDAWA